MQKVFKASVVVGLVVAAVVIAAELPLSLEIARITQTWKVT